MTSVKAAILPKSAPDERPAGDAPPEGAPSELCLRLCVLCSCGAVYAARTAVPLVVQDMAAELGWSSLLVGYVLSFFFWGYATSQVVGGYWADRVGGARVMVVVSLVGSASLLAMPWLAAVWPPAAVLLRFLLGAVQGPHFPSVGSITGQLVRAERRPRFFTFVQLGSPLGTVLVGMVGSLLLQRHGWRTVVNMTGLLYALTGVWLHVLTRRCRPRVTPSSAGSVAAPSGVPWRALLTSRAVWVCIWVHMTHTVTWFMLISWLPSYFRQTHPAAVGWLVNTLPFICHMAGTLSSVRLAEHLMHRRHFSVTAARKTLEVTSQLLAAGALLLLPLVAGGGDDGGGWPAAVALTSVAAAAMGLHGSAGLMLPQDLCPQHVGSMFGIMNTGGAVSGFLGNMAAGYLLSVYGEYGPMFQMAAALTVAGSLTFAVFGSAERLSF